MATAMSPIQIVTALFNNASEIAQKRAEEYTESRSNTDAKLASLTGKVPPREGNIPWGLPANSIDPNNAYVSAPDDAKITPLKFDTYKDRLAEVHAITVERILAIYQEFMPEGGLLDEGPLKGLLLEQLNGTGIDPSTEAARTAKARNQIISEGQATQREVMASFAARRFPIPPGAMVAALHQSQIGMQARIADLSDKVAAERAQAEAQHRRDMFDLLVQLRLAVIQAAGDLMQTVVGLMQTGTADILGAEKYNADVHKLRMAWVKRNHEEQKFSMFGRGEDTNRKSFEYQRRMDLNQELVISKKIELLTAQAQAISAQLASVLNSLHGSVSIGAGASTTVGYNYSNDTEGPAPTVSAI